MGLAEPKRKTKMSFDPNNTTWGEDTSKFGYQLMNKMGWKEGQGLGRNKDGSKDHIKVRVKNNALGIGAKQGHDDNWLELQASFNNLLENLTQSHTQGVDNREVKVSHLEEKTSASRRIFYSRFVKSKDVSKYSSSDMASIFGERAVSESPAPVMEETKQECVFTGVTTTTNTMSISDYFAQKMAEKRMGGSTPQPSIAADEDAFSVSASSNSTENEDSASSDTSAEPQKKSSKKEKKSKKGKKSKKDTSEKADDKKREKKSKKKSGEEDEVSDEKTTNKTKKGKSKTDVTATASSESGAGEDGKRTKKSKKSKVDTPSVEESADAKSTKKSKSKKSGKNEESTKAEKKNKKSKKDRTANDPAEEKSGGKKRKAEADTEKKSKRSKK